MEHFRNMVFGSIDEAELARKNPDALLRQLILIALASIVIILSLAATGIYAVYSRHVISLAEREGMRVGNALLALERDALLSRSPAEGSRLDVDAGKMVQLDLRLRKFLIPFHILKIKIFSRDGRVIYSTDSAIIGHVDVDNLHLQRALSGQPDSRLKKKDEILDLADERRFEVDVVETYIPIRDDTGQVMGSFELYVDVTPSYREIAGVVGLTVLLLALALLFVFASAFVLVRRGTLQLKATQDVLKALATTDALTGLPNRYQIFLRAEQELSRLGRQTDRPNNALGLIMIDVDHFKRHNDIYGHQAGDLVLKEIAVRIGRSLRPYDSVGRYGGEEFLVVSPSAGFEETRAIAERIRQRVEARPVPIDGTEVSVTVSLGLACMQGDEEGGFEEILRRADLGLYRAKSEGRNRVAWVEKEAAAPILSR
jgi:diguanylate cyclase (GGDEF)-like protein